MRTKTWTTLGLRNGALHCPSKPRFSVDEKINAVKRRFEGKGFVESVAREIGCSNVTIYNWRNKYIQEGVFSPMDENRKKRTQNVMDSNDVDQFKQQLYELQMEVDILKETPSVIKKDPGVNQKNLKNRKKVAVIDAMKYRLAAFFMPCFKAYSHKRWRYHSSSVILFMRDTPF